MPHFRKYGVFDDVTIDDRTDATFELHLIGEDCDDLVRHAGAAVPDERDYSHVAAELALWPVRIVRERPAGLPGLTIVGDREDAPAVVAALKATARAPGLTEVGPAAFEALRITAGTPIFGKDVTDKNLPQEFARDDRAISFVKGCYLGQETVARIDAVGHVNQVFKGLVFEHVTHCPAPGTALEADGKRVGVITSSVELPWRSQPVGLGMVRTSHAAPGTILQVAGTGGPAGLVAQVCDFPFSRP
jgi:folate-binding protein YgfZ